MRIINVLESSDGLTKKFIQISDDDLTIETVYVDYPNKHIICYSTQFGCNVGCKFCYNGLQHNFTRNLTSAEIYEQITNVIEYMHIGDDKPILFSGMGIGEPLINYRALITSMHDLAEERAGTKFAIATSGCVPDRIYDLVDDTEALNFKLTISLHASTDQKRKKIMPMQNVSVKQIIKASSYFQQKTFREVEYNYTLISQVNDSRSDAIDLAHLIQHMCNVEKSIIKINKFNEIPNSRFRASPNLRKFIRILSNQGLRVEYYETNGSDIGAACGQLIYNH